MNEAAPELVANSSTHTSFTTTVTDPFDNANGMIVRYVLLLVRSEEQPAIDVLEGEPMKWSEIQASGESAHLYQPFPDCGSFSDFSDGCVPGNRRRRAAGENIDVHIGTAECTADSDAYCNGPLQPDSAYFLALKAFTEHGLYRYTGWSAPVKTSMSMLMMMIMIMIIFIRLDCIHDINVGLQFDVPW